MNAALEESERRSLYVFAYGANGEHNGQPTRVVRFRSRGGVIEGRALASGKWFPVTQVFDN